MGAPTVIVQKLKRLEDVVDMPIVDPIRDDEGWTSRDREGFSSTGIRGCGDAVVRDAGRARGTPFSMALLDRGPDQGSRLATVHYVGPLRLPSTSITSNVTTTSPITTSMRIGSFRSDRHRILTSPMGGDSDYDPAQKFNPRLAPICRSSFSTSSGGSVSRRYRSEVVCSNGPMMVVESSKSPRILASLGALMSNW